ncbi:MAG: hypothetical protein ACM3ZQ_09180, partial [Bacillota bacterium]
MGEPLKLGRKVLVVLLIVVLLGSSLYPPGGYVKAAPFIPGGTAEPLPGTLEGLIKARTGKIAGYHVDEDRIVPTERALQKSPQAPQGSSGNSYGIVGLGVWESPNRVLLRWTPNNGWIPKDGYTLVRLVDGEPTPLASGLGTANPVYLSASQGLTLGSQSSSSGGTGTNGTAGKSGTGGAIQQPGAVTPPKLPGTTPASPSKVLQLGDQTVSTEEFVSSI